MRNLLVKLATIIAMGHMGLGCAWHHGMAASHNCLKHGDSALSNDQHGQQHCGHHHQQTTEPTHGDLPCDPICDWGDKHPPHSGCQDDGCSFIKSCGFDLHLMIDFDRSMGGVASFAVLSDSSLQAADSVGVAALCTRYAPQVRAHLYLCVQLL